MQVQKLIKELRQIQREAGATAEIRIASDEEWNTIFNDIEINKNADNGEFVIFGLSGSQQEETY